MASVFAPVITAAGITAPTFAQNLSSLISIYTGIFGADSYLGNDSQDGQYIGALAQAFTDIGAAAVSTYNAFSPATAQGNGLSSNVKINGLTKKVPSPSTAPATLVGVANTVITNGLIGPDANGNTWALPASVTIPASGTVTVTATCLTAGAIAATAGTITAIKTPVFGWQTVTNATATPGAPVETDAALRVRQAESTALPSVTVFDGIVAAIKQVAGVTRARGYENNTGSTDGNGIPAKTLAFVVEGGANADIWAAIASKIPPGIPTLGAVSGTVTSANGSTRVINFARPTAANINIVISLKALTGWSSTDHEPLIALSDANFLNALDIGSTINFTRLISPSYVASIASFYNITGLTIAKNGGAAGTSDIALAYNEAPIGATANVTFVVT
jgi:hypothetical protein